MPSRNKNVKPNPLQRGSACLCCRKRKMRCDGVRPSCTQCVKGNRADMCDFDDRRRKSRTQMLQEKLLSLEQKLRKLEGPSTSSSTAPQKVYHQDFDAPPYAPDEAHIQDTTMINLMPVFDSVAPGNLLSAFELLETIRSPGTFSESIFDFLPPLSPSRSPTPVGVATGGALHRYGSESSTSSQQGEKEGLSLFFKQELLALFLAHRHQCSFEVDTNRLQSFDVHPALINAVYLSACYFSQSPRFAELETHFLVETLNAIATGLEHSDRLIDVASALCLVAVYHYANCRISEGYRHSFTAARLGINLGLHQISTTGSSPQDILFSVIPSTSDSKELSYRINVFWQVFVIDRSWSVANGLPTALPGDYASKTLKIETPLPRPMDPGVAQTSFIPALRAEAVTLYERAYRISSSSLKNVPFWAERQEVGQALDKFASIIPPFLGPDLLRTQPPGIDVDLLIVHAMVNVAYIYLQRDHLGKSMSASELCLKAAHTISSHIRQLRDEDYRYLDPIISACWNTVGKLYLHLIVVSAKSNNRGGEMHGVAGELNVLILALKKLGDIFPIGGHHAAALEQERTDRCRSPGNNP